MLPVLRKAEVSGAQRTRLFPFQMHGTHGEGALTEPGPPQEFGRQAGAADGQSHPEALPSRPLHSCQMDPVGPMSFCLIQILIGPLLCPNHAYYAGLFGEQRGWPEGRENRDKKTGFLSSGNLHSFQE